MIYTIIHTRPRGWQEGKEVGREEEKVSLKHVSRWHATSASPPPRTTLPGLAERKHFGIPSATIIRSQCFNQFQISWRT